ncbi:hypothetical protein NPX13_g3600 [Xylaria arbuscula]|uniref:Uncharacterized protein n=1 Tax=Xylaria arbuscula TaxID=114810 RepID=A0A9W8NH04_9PEZI|nr:hypothetical protein NPX13_g3600 [Xylaria arbuscula]
MSGPPPRYRDFAHVGGVQSYSRTYLNAGMGPVLLKLASVLKSTSTILSETIGYDSSRSSSLAEDAGLSASTGISQVVIVLKSMDCYNGNTVRT